jgi:hypothetical protein
MCCRHCETPRSRLRSNPLPRGSLQEQVEPGAKAENRSVTSEPARVAHLSGECIRSPLSIRCTLHSGDRAMARLPARRGTNRPDRPELPSSYSTRRGRH